MNLFGGLMGEHAQAVLPNRAARIVPCVPCPQCRGAGGGESEVLSGPDVVDVLWEDCTMCDGAGCVGDWAHQAPWWLK